MKALLLETLADLEDNPEPLVLRSVPDPEPAGGEVLVRVSVCGVCHTELDEIEGRAPPPELPVIPGHQVVGRVVASGKGVSRKERVPVKEGAPVKESVPVKEGAPTGDGEADVEEVPDVEPGDRVGVAWIYHACGVCRFCRSGLENLCPRFEATGRDVDGGYAEYLTVPAGFVHRIPERLPDAVAAPLLCAGAIGYRSLALARLEGGDRLGLTGFGASGHLVLKLVRHRMPGVAVHVFARSPEQREFARELGAVWAGGTEDTSPEPLDAIIDTTPAWKPLVEALKSLAPGGRLVVNAIRKEDGDQDRLLELDYAEHLWMEKEIKSVANVTRSDVREFLEVAAEMEMVPEVEEFELSEANRALVELKRGGGRGAKVLRVAR